MMFYCAMNEQEAIAWQDGEQTLNPETGEVEPIGFIPDFVCEWDGVGYCYTVIHGELIPPKVIPFAGWDVLKGDMNGV